jgi:hypothetical protein
MYCIKETTISKLGNANVSYVLTTKDMIVVGEKFVITALVIKLNLHQANKKSKFQAYAGHIYDVAEIPAFLATCPQIQYTPAVDDYIVQMKEG